MPHPESEHGLRVQLATALRERDAALASETYWHNAAMKDRDTMNAVRSALAAANARADAAYDAGYAKAYRVGLTDGRGEGAEALAAARLEIESLKTALAAAQESK